MLSAVVLWLLLFKGASSQVTGSGDMTADFGGNAHYKCALADSTGVLQVTWQRLYKDESIENLATYSRRFGKQVNEPQLGKIVFTEASLNSTSITVKNVTWADEACYICSFNVYPDGSTRKQTCLTVQGISNVITDVPQTHSRGPDDMAVSLSCSATGKPAPTIRWETSTGVTSDKPKNSMVLNEDQTFTSSSHITLRPSPDWDGVVDCLLNAGMRGQRRERIALPLFNGRREKKDDEEKGETGQSQAGIAIIVIVVIIISCCVVLAVVKWKRLQVHRRAENSEECA